MTYVDDIFVIGSEDVVSAVAQEIQSTWTVTEPEVVSEVPVRFLGMDILKVKEEGTEGWMINQESYVKDLVGRQVGEEIEKRIPISRGFGNSPTSQGLPQKNSRRRTAVQRREREGTHDPGFYGCLVFTRRRRKSWMSCGHAQ